MTRSINSAGLSLIKHFEGCRLRTYLDAGGRPTIGVGHLILPGEDFSKGITQQQADQLLQHDLISKENGVERLVQVELGDNQFSALVSFAFNLGLGNLAASTLLKKIKVGDSAGIACEWVKWCHDHGQILKGLVLRRQAELALFNTPDDVSVSLDDIENQ